MARRPNPKDMSNLGSVRFWTQSSMDWTELLLQRANTIERAEQLTPFELESLRRMHKLAVDALELVESAIDRIERERS